VQGYGLDELYVGACQAVELRAVGQGRESITQVSLGVAVEVPLAGESVPTGKEIARVMTSLSERDASGPGFLFGG